MPNAAPIQITITISPTIEGPIDNTATVSASSSDPTLSTASSIFAAMNDGPTAARRAVLQASYLRCGRTRQCSTSHPRRRFAQWQGWWREEDSDPEGVRHGCPRTVWAGQPHRGASGANLSFL